ncbi:hypothetical protein BC830DRAFT_1144573 [Chytriomyces sp. MP71]|nr:hypothetical protein BC830DRAFT_1144573 [Chytriomyces sp. MP71]
MLDRIWFQLLVILSSLVIIVVTIIFVPGSADVDGFQAHLAFATSFMTVSVFLSIVSTLQGINLTLAIHIFTQHLVRLCIDRSRIKNERIGGLLGILDITVAGHVTPLFDFHNVNSLLTGIGFFGLLLLVKLGDVLAQGSAIQGTGLYPFDIQVYTANTFALAPGMLNFDPMNAFEGNAATLTPSGLFKNQFTFGMLEAAVDCSSTETCGARSNNSATLVSCPTGFTNCTTDLAMFLDYQMECRSSSSQVHFDQRPFQNAYNFTSSVVGSNDNDGLNNNPSTRWTVTLHTANSNILVNISCTIFPALTSRTENSEHGTINTMISQVIKNWSYDGGIKDDQSFAYIVNGTTLHSTSSYPIWQIPELGNMTNSSSNYSALYEPDCLGQPTTLCIRTLLMASLDELSESVMTSGDHSGSTLSTALKVSNTSRGTQNSQEQLELNMRFMVERAYKRSLASTLVPGLNKTVKCKRCGFSRATWTNKVYLVGIVVGMNGLGIVLMLASIGITIAWGLPYRKIHIIEVIKNYEKVEVLKEEAAMAELELQATLRARFLKTSSSDIKA